MPPLSMRALLLALVSATALPLLFLALYLIQNLVAGQRLAIRDALMHRAETLSALVDNEIDTHIAIAASIAASPALDAGDFATFSRQADTAIRAFPGAWLAVSDPTGRIVISTLSSATAPISTNGVRDVIQRAWATRTPQVSAIIEGPHAKRIAIVVYPVFKDAQPFHAIVTSLDPSRFLELIRAKSDDTATIAVVDKKYNFVARVPEHERRLGTPASDGWRAAMTRAPKGFSDNATLEGDSSLTAYAPTRDGWTVGIAYPLKVLDAPMKSSLWTMGCTGLISLLVSLGLAFILARRADASMGQLAKGARAIAKGAVVPVETLVIREAEEVNRALHSTSAVLATQNAALLRSHQTFSSLVLQAPFGVYLIDSQFRISQISAGAQKVFAGFQSIIGRDLAEVLCTLWPEPFASEAIGRFRHTLATGEPFHQLEVENRRRDTGSGEAYDWKLERVTLPDGEHGVVCYFYDLTAQKNAEAALRDSETRYRTAIQAGGLGTWETDYSTKVRKWTPEGMALFGLSLPEGIGQFGGSEDELYRCVHPEDRHLFEGFRSRMQALSTMTVEYRIIRPDGKIRWISGHGTVLTRDPAGRPIKSVHIAADFTERKERDKQVQLLLSEVNHRAKNMLGLVLSVARQTAGGDNQQFVQRFTERVHSLAASQDLLVKSKWKGVLLDELVGAQLAFFEDLIDVRIKLQGGDVRLSPAAAQTIGMALHELATNASKHGSLSAGTGQVDIAWELHTVSERRRFRLTWTETNGPLVVAPARSGFGSTVTGTMVKMSLAGEVTTEFTPSGFTWRVDCPAEAVVDGPQLADTGQYGNPVT